MLEIFTKDTFEENDIFKLYYEKAKYVELKLVKISESKFIIPNKERQGFSLLFKTSKDFMIEQGMHEMEQERVGHFEIGLVPVIAPYGEKDFYFYEALFN
jgi:hypothetical protein